MQVRLQNNNSKTNIKRASIKVDLTKSRLDHNVFPLYSDHPRPMICKINITQPVKTLSFNCLQYKVNENFISSRSYVLTTANSAI